MKEMKEEKRLAQEDRQKIVVKKLLKTQKDRKQTIENQKLLEIEKKKKLEKLREKEKEYLKYLKSQYEEEDKAHEELLKVIDGD